MKDNSTYWFCMSPEFQTFPTYVNAMNECIKDNRCGYVYESDCDDTGPFQICPKWSGIGPSSNGCLYQRDGSDLLIKIFFVLF